METIEEAARSVSFDVRNQDDGAWLVPTSSLGYPSPALVEYVLRHPMEADRRKIQKVLAQLPDPKEYLKRHKVKYSGADLLLLHGKEFLTKDWGEQREFQTPGKCYKNSVSNTCIDRSTLYAEGICVSPWGTEYHAWNIKDGYVLDSSWPVAHLSRYFGTVFDLRWLVEVGFPYGCLWARYTRYKRAQEVLQKLFQAAAAS